MKYHLILALFLSACGTSDLDDRGWGPLESGEPNQPGEPSENQDPTGPYNPQLLRSCLGKSILELRENTLWRVEMDGAETEVFQFGATSGATTQYINTIAWQNTSGFHALSAYVAVSDSDYVYEVVMLSDDGTILHHKVLPNTNRPTIQLSPAGHLAVDLTDAESYVVQLGQEPMGLGRYHPIARQVGDEILVRDQPQTTPDAKYGWLNLKSNAFRALSHAPDSVGSMFPVGDQLLYMGANNTLVLEGPTHQSTVVLTEAVYVVTSDSREQSIDDDFVLLSNSNAYFRADLQGDLKVDLVKFPEDEQTNWPSDRNVRADGAILATRTVADGLQAVISEDLGQTWSDVSTPIPTREDGFYPAIAQRHANGNVLLLEIGVGYGYYLESAQAITPEGSSEVVTHGLYTGGPYDLNGVLDFADDGGCAVMWRQPKEQGPFEGPFELITLDFSTHDNKVIRTADRLSELRFTR
jgi:hypothetical protein